MAPINLREREVFGVVDAPGSVGSGMSRALPVGISYAKIPRSKCLSQAASLDRIGRVSVAITPTCMPPVQYLTLQGRPKAEPLPEERNCWLMDVAEDTTVGCKIGRR